MRKVIVLFVFVLCFTSCKKEPFFSNFDTIEYYQLAIEDTIVERVLIENKDSVLVKTIDGRLPKNLKDEIFFSEINSDRFIKREFASDDLHNFINLFNSNVFLNVNTTACVPIYRDFLILKEKNKTVGIINICIDCQMHNIKTKNNNFGGGIEGSELETLLKKYQTQ